MGRAAFLVVEADFAHGFRRGRNLDRIGVEAADTSEFFFDNVWAPEDAVLGEGEGRGFHQLMDKLSQERLLIAIHGVGSIDRALAETTSFARQRMVCGKPLIESQNAQIQLAACKTQATVVPVPVPVPVPVSVFVEHCIFEHLAGRLDAVTASMPKYWVTDTQGRIVDECLQLHGAEGYMLETLLAQMSVTAAFRASTAAATRS